MCSSFVSAPSGRHLLLTLAGLALGCGATRQNVGEELPEGTPLAVSLRTHPDHIEVFAEGQLFARVRFDDPAGPCIAPIYSRGGVAVTRPLPVTEADLEGLDHPHHRSLWFAHGDVDGVDFWHGSGHIEMLGFRVSLTSYSSARIELSLLWRAPDEREVLRERRRLEFHAEAGARWIEVTHELTPSNSGVVFGDTKEGTFALRLRPSLQVDGPEGRGVLFDSELHDSAEVWGKRARWIAVTGPAEDESGAEKRLTVAIFDHPANLRHPTWWHARTYGLLAANPFGQGAFEGRTLTRDGTYPLSRGDTLRLRYRVLIGDGPLLPPRLEAEAQRFVGEPIKDAEFL